MRVETDGNSSRVVGTGGVPAMQDLMQAIKAHVCTTGERFELSFPPSVASDDQISKIAAAAREQGATVIFQFACEGETCN